jgi:hypothetical protein
MTAPGRECGDCTLCCKVMAIEQLAKPASSWCPHCKPGHGCRIYPERPDECRSFNCLWLVNERLDERWRRKQPCRGEIQQWAVSGETRDVTVIVAIGQKTILVTPDREFDLGVVGPDQRIVRELEGTHVVGATVVNEADLARRA